VNRAEEITPLVAEKLNKLADNGILMGSQSVLLKDVNDDAKVLYDLFYKLLVNRVRPYYLFQCDPINGSSHFRVPVEKGLELMDELRKTASGYAIPTYAIDIPNRFGKIAVLPNRIKGKTADGMLEVENFDGEIYKYPS
jgi:lysine 2,3-aminomutase